MDVQEFQAEPPQQPGYGGDFPVGIEVVGVPLVAPVEVREAGLGDQAEGFGGVAARTVEIGGDGKTHFLKAEVPLRKIFGYATGVRSISKGTALYSMRLLGYRPATV